MPGAVQYYNSLYPSGGVSPGLLPSTTDLYGAGALGFQASLASLGLAGPSLADYLTGSVAGYTLGGGLTGGGLTGGGLAGGLGTGLPGTGNLYNANLLAGGTTGGLYNAGLGGSAMLGTGLLGTNGLNALTTNTNGNLAGGNMYYPPAIGGVYGTTPNLYNTSSTTFGSAFDIYNAFQGSGGGGSLYGGGAPGLGSGGTGQLMPGMGGYGSGLPGVPGAGILGTAGATIGTLGAGSLTAGIGTGGLGTGGLNTGGGAINSGVYGTAFDIYNASRGGATSLYNGGVVGTGGLGTGGLGNGGLGTGGLGTGGLGTGGLGTGGLGTGGLGTGGLGTGGLGTGGLGTGGLGTGGLGTGGLGLGGLGGIGGLPGFGYGQGYGLGGTGGYGPGLGSTLPTTGVAVPAGAANVFAVAAAGEGRPDVLSSTELVALVQAYAPAGYFSLDAFTRFSMDLGIDRATATRAFAASAPYGYLPSQSVYAAALQVGDRATGTWNAAQFGQFAAQIAAAGAVPANPVQSTFNYLAGGQQTLTSQSLMANLGVLTRGDIFALPEFQDFVSLLNLNPTASQQIYNAFSQATFGQPSVQAFNAFALQYADPRTGTWTPAQFNQVVQALTAFGGTPVPVLPGPVVPTPTVPLPTVPTPTVPNPGVPHNDGHTH